MTNTLHDHKGRMGDVVGERGRSYRELLSSFVRVLEDLARELRIANDGHVKWVPQHESSPSSSPSSRDEVLTRSQVAELLSVCTESVSRLVREDSLPCRRVGKEYRFLRSEVVAWLASRGGVQ
jgi:excisionase family DNA binding protein